MVGIPLTGATPDLPTHGLPCPPEPWVAARLEPGATLLSPDILMLLGDLGRCLGWAWVDLVETRHAEA